MKNTRKTLALSIALILLLTMAAPAFAASIYSSPFKLPAISATPEPEKKPAKRADKADEEPHPVTLLEAAVRVDADSMSEILDTVPEGEEVEVLEVEGDWVKVKLGEEEEGYIFIEDLEGVELPEAEEVPEEEEDPENPNFEVMIFTSRRTVVEPGETITLTSRIEGPDGYEIFLQWECDKGEGFEPVEGAHGEEYSYIADETTLTYRWRLALYYR